MKALLKLSNVMEKAATKKYILIFMFIMLAVGYMSMNNVTGTARLKEISNGTGTLDMKYYYNSKDAYSTLNLLGGTGRKFYANWLAMDFFVSLSTMILHSILISFFLKKLDKFKKYGKVNLLPFIRGALDYIENFIIIIMLFNYPEEYTVAASVAGLVTSLKWILFVICIIIILILVLMTVIKSFKSIY
ncbi:hypothetical protein [Clostridium sp.]|uniref:hypothetical protein n=1 Tax=Clostridium sp. TaxID=1506 RepID=UPI00263467B0|nr:hypothetical protein [Clostridium sp.]